MANLVEVFTQEWDRENPAEWSKIHLYKIGDFWRAYDWSAWLISVISYNDNVRMTTKDRKPLHVTRMRRTDVEDATYCFVGFPIKSVEKYIPERETFESVDDKHTASYNLRQSMFGEGEFAELIEYDADMRKGWLAA